MQSVSYIKSIPTHEKKYAVGKSGSNATFNLFFLGLDWPWVGEFVGFTIIIIFRAVFIEQLFPQNFPLFFFSPNNRQEKQETFPKFGNLTEGKKIGRLRIPIFGNKN